MLKKPKTYFRLFFKRVLSILVLAILCLLILFTFFYIDNGNQLQNDFIGVRKVFIGQQNGQYRFYKNGQPFLVKGGAGFSFVKELALNGGNTLLCWDTSKIAQVLDEAEKYNMAVVIGLDIPGTDNIEFYKDQKNIDSVYNLYSKIVVRYKDNGALLAWCLGNELAMDASLQNIPFFKSYNRLLKMIHQNDPQHPVSTAIIGFPKMKLIGLQFTMPGIDFISINTYNDLKTLEAKLDDIKTFWKGPYLLNEWGPNGAWESARTTWHAPIENTSTKKAEQFAELYTKYMPLKNSRFLGSLAFYWGVRQEYTNTWYNFFSEDSIPNEITEVLKDCWKDTITKHLSPNLRYMLVDSLGAADNIVFSPGTQHKATIVLDTWTPKDTLFYKWQVFKEDWQNWGKTWDNFKQIAPETGLFTDSSVQHPAFITPIKSGPYRIYVTVYNSKGYCASANTPIYVEE